MIKFKGLVAPTDVPTGDGRMFAPGKMTHRPCPIPVMAQFGSGGHAGAVPVGKITAFTLGPGGYWAEGYFLDPAMVPEVPRAIYMLQEKVLGPSVDLDRDYTVKVVPHPMRPDKTAARFEEYNVIGTTLVPMPAFYQVHMAIETAEEKSLLASAGVNVGAMLDMTEFAIAAGTEMVFATSFEDGDEAECGCTSSETSELTSNEMVPVQSGSTTMQPVANVNWTSNGITVGTATANMPSSVTVTFGGYMGPSVHMNPMMGPEMYPANPQMQKVEIMERPECHFNEEGHCVACGY